jgi:tetratricopeptide (TPR) repeat protein
MIRDTKQAQLLEQESKAVKTDKDADALIEDALAKIAAEPENINHYRTVARLYTQRHLFAEAVGALQKALEISAGDPEVSAAISRTRLQQFDYEIKQSQDSGDAAGAEAKELEKAQFAFDDLQERVKRYPNDLALRYDLGVVLFDNDYINEAIQQFQLSQRSPQHRIKSLYYMGLCFKRKQQYDLASEQLTQAVSGLAGMDEMKKDIIYELGALAEAMGDTQKAVGFYKQIYQVDIGFKDVAGKVEKAYQG